MYLLKHILLLSAFLLSSSYLSAQEEVDLSKRTELKINGLYLIAGIFELDYEYIIDEGASAGISAAVYFDNTSEYDWSITPHYRLFFSKTTALGFFLETHAGVISQTSKPSTIVAISDEPEETIVTGTAGLAIGWKAITKSDIVGEVYFGFGVPFKSLGGISGFTPRTGISIGKRF